MSRAINKSARADELQDSYIPPELADWWQKKQTYYTNPQNAKKIQKLFNEPKSQPHTTSDQVIILSRHPVDVLRMGDVETTENIVGDKIGHCHREGGEYARCAQQEALGHGPIAYLVNKKDLDYWLSGDDADERMASHVADKGPKHKISDFDNKEIFSDHDRDIKGIKVINRVRLRQFRDNETNEMWAVPEKQVYPGGAVVPGFLGVVMDWAWNKQKDTYEESYKEGEFPALDSFERLGGKYADTRDGQLLNAFFSKSGIDPEYPNDWVRYEDEESDELEPSPEERAEIMDDRVQDIMETMNERMKHASVHGEVDIYDEAPYVMMSANMGVSFNEDLFGEDGGAEWELPSGWREVSELAEEFTSALSGAPHYVYIAAEEMQIDEYHNEITFSFYINNEEYENNADGFDRFADYVESEYDSNYDVIRRIMKRVLIREGFMGPDAYENLHKQLKDTEENEDTLYRHWDFDIDGNEITFQLKDPASLVDGFPNLSGLYLGTIPAGTSLTYLFHDWYLEKSKEFDNQFIPSIRKLFDEAEKSALQQLSLPGVEAKEMHGLLLPSRAQFRLKQIYDSYDAPAHIYLQIKMEIEEDITPEQVEEIRYFLEYLDDESKIDIIQKAAVEIFDTARVKTVEKKKIEEKATRLATNIIPILNDLSLLELMRFATDINPDVEGANNHISELIERIQARAAALLPAFPAAKSAEVYAGGKFDEAVRGITGQINLKKVQDALDAAMESQKAASDVADPYAYTKSDEDWEQFQFGAAGKILGLVLTKATSGAPIQTLQNLAGAVEGLVATVIGRIKDAVHTAIRDPASARNVRNITRAFAPDPMPAWYKQQLDKAQLSVKRILDVLPSSVLGTRSPLVDQIVDLVQESESLMNRIDAKLNEQKKGKSTTWSDRFATAADDDLHIAGEEAPAIPTSIERDDYPAIEPVVTSRAAAPPGETNYPHEYQKDKEDWLKAYGRGGANEKAWLNKITRETGLKGKDATDYYDKRVMPRVQAALDTPLYALRARDNSSHYQGQGSPPAPPGEDPAEFAQAMRRTSSTGRRKDARPDSPRNFRKGRIRLDTGDKPSGWARPNSPNPDLRPPFPGAEPPVVVGHERAHAIQNVVGEVVPIEVENAAILKKLFPQKGADRLRDPSGTTAPAGHVKAHHQSRAEQAASTIQARRNKWLKSLKRGGNWEEFTADDIKKYKRIPLDRATPADSDLINAIQKELDPSLSNQEAADLLNQVVKRQPKAKRGKPTQAIAESKKRKYKVRIKKR